MKKGILLSGNFYQYYKDHAPTHGDYGIYGAWARRWLDMERGIFSIVSHVAVYAAGISLLLAVAYLIIRASNPEGLQEAKKWILRVLVLSVAVFSVTALIGLVQMAGMDAK